MTVFVLGGGPAGLAVVDGLADADVDSFVLIERDECLGGLARTLEWAGIGSHDLGPHKIFSLDEALVSRVMALLPADDWLTREKISSIYMRGHFLPYPPSPFSLSSVFGLPAFARMVAGYGLATLGRAANGKQPETFEEDIAGRLGRPLYEALFQPIAQKLWGDPRHLDVKLSQGRVQTPSLTEVIGRLLKLKSSSGFEALEFRYPIGGLGRLWAAIEKKAINSGEVHTSCAVSGLEVIDGSVRAIRVTSADGSDSEFQISSGDFIASTLPIGVLVRLLSGTIQQDVAAAARESIVLNDLILVFLHIDRPRLMKDSWVFVPDADIIFHRLSEQRAFDPEMTPSGSIVCCEIMSSETRQMAQRSDDDLIAAAVSDLRKMGFDDFSVRASKVVRLPKSYPVFRVGYESRLQRLLGELDKISNLRTLGRQGAFNYIGTLDAMDIGYGFVRWYANRSNASWDTERVRTAHYPVLD